MAIKNFYSMVPMLSKKEKTAALTKIYEVLVDLRVSPLYEYRTKNNFLPVLGEGNVDAPVVIIGEAPGKKEALTGKPFCGASGKFLDELCVHIGLVRAGVYVTNIVKDRPEDNRDPSQAEISLYGQFLDQQLAIIQPKVIATLGRFSMMYMAQKMGLQDKVGPIGEMHGKVMHGVLPYGDVALVTLYHPAVALYNGSMRDVLKKDFESLKECM
jgi:uracil-DNA glycosylase